MKLRETFGDRKFWRTLSRLSMPIIIQQLLVSSFALVDTLMVSQLGDIELSAAGMAGQWNWMLSMMLFGICNGMAVFVSQYWGVKNIEKIRKSFCIAAVSALLIALPFFVSGGIFPKLVMGIFTKKREVFDAGVAYLSVAAFSYPALALSNVFSALLRSTEKVKLPMYVAIITTLENCLLNYALIFGKFGMPGMGIKGAALATTLSAWTGPVFILIVSAVKKNILIFNPKVFFTVKLNEIKEFFSKALLVAANETCWGFGTLIFNIIYSNLGYEYYAAVTILRTFEELSFCLFIGMCDACAIMVGKSVGRGDIEIAVRDSKRFAVLEPATAVALGIVFVFLRKPLVQVFNLTGNITEKTLTVATTIMVIYAVEMALRNLPYIQIVGLFRAGGDATSGAKFDLACLWMISIPATLLNTYVFKLPFPVIFALMYICEDIPKSVLCIRHFLSGKWIRPVTEQGRTALKEYRKTHKGL